MKNKPGRKPLTRELTPEQSAKLETICNDSIIQFGDQVEVIMKNYGIDSSETRIVNRIIYKLNELLLVVSNG